MRKALSDSLTWRGIYFFTTLLLNVLIARVYQAAQSGWIYYISNNYSLVLLIGGLSLDSSMTYFASGKKIPQEKLALFSLSWPFVVAFFSLLCTGFLIFNHKIENNHVFLLIAGTAYAFGISLTNFFTSLFYARQQYAMPNIFMSIINILIIALIPVFAKGFFGLSRQGFLYVYFFQFMFQGVGLALVYVSPYFHKNRLQYPNNTEMKKIFRYAFVALWANVAYYLINKVDYFFVQAWCPPKSLGNYVQVSKMGQLLLIVPSIIAGAVYPLAASGQSGMLKPIVRIASLFVLLYIVIFLVSYICSNEVFLLVFGKTYDEMFVPFLILLPGILFLSIHIIIAAYFGGKNKVFYNLVSTGAGLAVVLLGDILLIKKTGIAGAAFVSSLGYATAFIVSMVLFITKTGTSLMQFFSPEIFRFNTYAALFADKSSNVR